MNRFGSLFKPLTWFMAVSLAAFVAGCGGGDDGGGPPPPAAPIGLVSGNWTIQEVTPTTADNPACTDAQNNALDNYVLTVTQTGNSLTVTRGPETPVAGTISGDQITWSGNVYDEPGIAGGRTTVTSATATVAAGSDCNSISGSFNWSHTNPSLSCTGTSNFTGTGDGSGCGV